MILESSPATSRRRGTAHLLARFVLYWLVKALVTIFLWGRALFRSSALRYGLLALLAAGAVAWNALGRPTLALWTSHPTDGITINVATTQPPPPPSVERYMRAQASFDAAGMWESMSDALRQRMALTGNTLEKLQRDLETARQQQRRYTAATYVGGIATDGGHGVYFYVLTMEGPNGTSRLPYTFVVDQDGKIMNIQWSVDQ